MPNTLPPSLTGKSLLDDKKERIAAKAEEKKEILDPIQARLDRQLAMANARVAQGWESVKQAQVDNAALIQAREDAFDADRSTPVEKYLRDAGIKASQMLVGVVGGGISLASDLVSKGAGEGLNTVLPGAEGLSDVLDMGNPMRAYGAAPATQIETPEVTVPSVAPKVSAATRAAIDGMESWTSKQSQASARVAAGERAEDTARIDAEYVADLKKGNGKLSAQLAREAKNAGSAFIHAVDDPNNLVNNLATAAPTVAIAAMTGGGALGVMGVTGGMEGAGAYQQVADQIAATSYEDLKSQFPDVTRMIEEGASEEAIRAHLVTEVGLPAAVTTSIAAALISKISLPFAKDPLGMARRTAAKEVSAGIERPLSGSIPGLVKSELLEAEQEAKRLLLQDMLSEATEEAGQGLVGQMAVNQANRDAGNTNVELLDNTGAVIGEGAAVGALMPAALRAPGYALEGTAAIPSAAIEGLRVSAKVLGPVIKATGSAASKVTAAAVQGAGKLAEGRANRKVRDAADETARAAQTEARTAAADSTRAAIDASTVQLDLTKAATQLSEADVRDLSEGSLENLDQLAVFSAVVDKISDPDFDFGKGQGLMAYAVQSQAAIQKLARDADAQLKTSTDPVEQESLALVSQRAKELLSHTTVKAIDQFASELPKISDEQLQKLTEASKADAESTLDPEVLKAVETVRALVVTGHTKGLDPKQIDGARILATRDGDSYEQNLLLQASYIASERERHEAVMSEFKTIPSVGMEMRTEGFVFGGKVLNSLQDYVDEVMGLAGAGQVGATSEVMTNLRKWAERTEKRLKAFNAAANAQLDKSGPGIGWGNRVETGFKQLDESGQAFSKEKMAFADLAFEKGVQLGQAMEEDARTIARVYNHLLGVTGGNTRLPEVEVQPWKARYDQVKAQMDGAVGGAPTTPVNPEPTGATNAAEVVAETKPTESAAPQAPAKTEGEAPVSAETGAEETRQSGEGEKKIPSRIRPEQAKRFTDEALNDRLNELMAKRAAGTATPADDATFDVLDDEMSERETRAAEAIAAQEEADRAEAEAEAEAEKKTPTLAVDFNNPTPATDAEFDAALELSQDDYIQAVSGGKVTAPTKAKAIRDELAGLIPSESAQQIGQVEDSDVVLKAEGNYLYAVDPKVIDEDGDALTVGALYTTDEGTTLMVHPDSNYRGKGIGQALMRELLVRKPMAPSNGLSKAARQLRLKVLDQIRQERNKPVFTNVTERFPGVINQAPVGTGPRAANRLLSGFKLNSFSKSLFARAAQPFETLAEAMRSGLDAVRKLGVFERALTDDDATALQLFGEIADKLLERLNANLDEHFQKDWKRISKASNVFLWNAADQMALHLGERYTDDKGVERMRFQPQIAQGIVAGGMRWLLDSMNRPHLFDEETVSKLYPDGVLPPEFLEWFRSNKTYAGESDQLARAISDTLALSGLDDVTRTSTEGLPLTMAASFMEAATDMELLWAVDLKPEEAFKNQEERLLADMKAPGAQEALATLRSRRARLNGKTTKFLSFPEEADGENHPLTFLNKLMGGSSELLDGLFGGYNNATAHIGKAPRSVNSTVKGVNVKAGDAQVHMLKTLSNIPQYSNVVLQDMLGKIPGDLLLRLFGEIPYDEDETSLADLDRLRGLRISALRTRKEIGKLQDRTKRYAETAKKPIEKVPLFWNYRVNSNGRAEQQGFGGQNNKWARELFVPGLVEMDTTNEGHMRDYYLALAQAFDIKVENDLNDVAIAKLHTLLDGKLLPLLTKFGEATESGEITDPEALVNDIIGMGFGNQARAFNALQTHARFLVNQGTTFQHGLVFEVDGKTDGPVNALVQFGLTHLGSKLLRQLAQGGLFLGQETISTLAENFDANSPDLYANPIQGFNAKLKELLENRNFPDDVRAVFLNSAQGLRRTNRLKQSEGADGKPVLEGLRNLFKNPFTQKTYGAGDRSIMISAAKDVASNYGQMINEALQNKTLLPQDVVTEIRVALGVELRTNAEGTKTWTQNVPVMRLQTLEDYKKFQIHQHNLDALVSQLNRGIGDLMARQINKEMESVNDTLGTVYKITAFQAAAFSFAYRQAYEARREELVKQDLLGPTDALSKQDEREILAKLRDLEPVFHTSQTEGGHGITMVKGFDSAPLPVREGKTGRDSRDSVQVVGAGKRFSSDINITYPTPEAGVRVAALLNIAAGDASMMGRVFQNVREWFNVFDGLEVLVGQLNQASREVNQAVWDNWMFDLLGSIEDQYAKFQFDFEQMDDGALNGLTDALHLTYEEKEIYFAKPKEPTRDEMLMYINEHVGVARSNLNYARRYTNAVKQAMTELRSSTDHMSGPAAPFQREGKVFATQDEVLAYLQTRVSEIMKGEAPPTETWTQEGKLYVPPNINTGGAVQLEPKPADDVSVAIGPKVRPAADAIRLLDEHNFGDHKVSGFVWTRIRKLVPSNLKVVHGTRDELMQYLADRGLDPKIDERGTGFFVPGAEPLVLILKKDGKRAVAANILLHELVHAVTHATVDAYFNGGAYLTRGQKDAMKSLIQLAHEMADMDTGKMPKSFRTAREVLQTYRAEGNVAGMVDELLAYGLTNPDVSMYLNKQKGLPGIRALGKRLLAILRGLLGLPENAPVDNFLAQTIDQFQRIIHRPVGYTPPVQSLLTLRASLEDDTASDSAEHSEHLDDVLERLEAALATVPDLDEELAVARAAEPNSVIASRAELRMAGAAAVVRMVQAGFDMTEKEKLVFAAVHAVVTGMGQLDPLAISELQDLHQQAMRELKSEHFMPDWATEGNQDAIDVSIARLDALRFVQGRDLFGRSELLANFVAMGTVNEQLRSRLSQMRMQGQKVSRDNFDSLLRTGARKLFDLAGGAVLKTWNRPQRVVLDEMLKRVSVAQKQAGAVKRNQAWGLVDKTEELIKSGLGRGYQTMDRVAGQFEARRVAGDDSMKVAAGLVASNMASLLLAPESKEQDIQTAITRLLNTNKIGDFFRSLGADLLGTNDGNRDIHRLLNQGKMHVSQIRQRLRDQVPKIIEGLFSKQMSKASMKLLHRTAGRTDMQTLVDTFSMTRIAELLRSPQQLQTEIQNLVGGLQADLASHINQKAESLGQYLVTKGTVNQDMFLARNAEAVLVRTEHETGRVFSGNGDERTAAIAEIDRLITLHALATLSAADKEETAKLLEIESEGMEKTLRMLRSVQKLEAEKAPNSAQRLNMWKGYLPTTLDPRRDLVLASTAYGAELEKRGYKLVGHYDGDRFDSRNGLAYYASKWSGGQSTYNQGALQTVENSLMGIDVLTGQTLDPAARMLISNPDEVATITAGKMAGVRMRGPKGRGPQLLPILNEAGEVVAYERPVSPALMQQHMRQEGHLADAIGMWLGRQAEESLAKSLNASVINALYERWKTDERENRADEYERIDAGPRSAVLKDAWETLPRHVQEALIEKFGDDGVMVRRELQNNALGYRAASVGDIFTGTSNISPETRKALENIAFALAGKRAYPLLVNAEKTWQGLVGTAKDIIVVRSGVVAVTNLLANQVQLLQMTGWNPARLLRVQLAAAKELEHYLRNRGRITEIVAAIGMETDAGEIKKLKVEQQSLEDANSRLSIMPLLNAGMLPTIAEGLTEQDQYTLLHDGMVWIEKKTEKLPKGVLTAAKYAVIAKDTALYQGLNRMVQFGDFMAKAALFQALQEQSPAPKGSEAEALHLDEVNESFVNYNLLAGRGRDYLENMGVTWFWNYKLRIQKIALRNFKRNPLRFMGMGVGAEWLGTDSLLSSSAPLVNWEYSVGPDQLWRAHQMILWRTLMM